MKKYELAVLIKKIGKYVKEVSVVVIGIALTLSVNGWITDRNERRNMESFLHAVKIELETNLELLEWSNKLLVQPAVRYANYLESLGGNPPNLDSLRYHIPNVIDNHDSFMFLTSAFEMFKISGYMRLIDDRELLLSIWNTYQMFSELVTASKMMRDKKWEATNEFLSLHGRNMSDEVLLKAPPLYNLYVNLGIHHFLTNMYNVVRGSIEETLAMFEKAP
jgi:hypothetical protein